MSSLWRRRLVLRTIRSRRARPHGGHGPGRRPMVELPILPEVVDAGRLSQSGRWRFVGPRGVHRPFSRDDEWRSWASRRTVSGPRGRPRHRLRSPPTEIRLDAAGLRERIERLDGDVRITPTRIEARRLALTWEQRRITGAGRIDAPFDTPTLDLTARGDADARAAGPAARRPPGRWRGWPGSTPAWRAPRKAPGDGDGLHRRPHRRPGEGTGRGGQLALADGVLSITQLTARAFDGSLTVRRPWSRRAWTTPVDVAIARCRERRAGAAGRGSTAA